MPEIGLPPFVRKKTFQSPGEKAVDTNDFEEISFNVAG
jgi:hypothetical protein